MTSATRNDNIASEFEVKILEYLKENPNGLTVTDIAKGISASRNTVSKYLGLLEEEALVYTKKVGAYHLYYNADVSQKISKSTLIQLYKGLLYGLKEQFPNSEHKIKEIGRSIADFYEIPLVHFEELVSSLDSDPGPSLRLIIKVLEEFNSYNELFDESTILSEIKVIEPKKAYGVRFSNFTLLQDDKDLSYHMYAVIGYVERLLSKRINRPIVCKIKDFHIGKDPKDCYVNVILELS